MNRSFRQVWAWPIALALLTASGLASALIVDGWGDWWAWLALGTPVLVAGWLAQPAWRRDGDGARRP